MRTGRELENKMFEELGTGYNESRIERDRELLIGVRSYFRDPEVMAHLREAVQKTLEHGKPCELSLDAVRDEKTIMPCIARN